MFACRTDRLVIAHARRRDLTEAENDAAVADLVNLAAGRGVPLAEVAGILEGASEAKLDEPLASKPLSCARTPVRTWARYR